MLAALRYEVTSNMGVVEKKKVGFELGSGQKKLQVNHNSFIIVYLTL